MLIIRKLNFIDAAFGIVTLNKWPSGTQPVNRMATYWEWWYQMLHQHHSTSWWWAYNARNM